MSIWILSEWRTDIKNYVTTHVGGSARPKEEDDMNHLSYETVSLKSN